MTISLPGSVAENELPWGTHYMFIHRFGVKNYMIHQDTGLDLSPITVLVGPQGGGKSSLFDAIINFSMLARGNLRQAFGPYPYSFRQTIHRSANTVSRISYSVEMSKQSEDQNRLQYEISYSQIGQANPDPKFMIHNERLSDSDGKVLFDRSEPNSFDVAAGLDLSEDRGLLAALRQAEFAGNVNPENELLSYCARNISRFNKFRLDPTVLAQPSRLPDATSGSGPRIGYHGDDLAATLYHLNETSDPALVRIFDELRRIDPSFDELIFSAVGTDRIAFDALYSDARGAVPAVRLSSGTLSFLGLITLLLTANRPPLLMIEEPENGLTPQAVKDVFAVVKKLAHDDLPENRSQVLMSSHSPFVICEAWNGDNRDAIHQVLVSSGRARVRKFSEAAEEAGIQLRMQNGVRQRLGLQNAEDIMSGYLSG